MYLLHSACLKVQFVRSNPEPFMEHTGCFLTHDPDDRRDRLNVPRIKMQTAELQVP